MRAHKVLVPVYGDECDTEALSLACDLTHDSKGKVYVVYVIEVHRELALDAEAVLEEDRCETVLERMENVGKRFHGNIQAEILRARDAGPALVQEAEEREVEAIVMALPYKRHHGVFSLGRTVPYILKNAGCPVILWHPSRSHTGLERNGS